MGELNDALPRLINGGAVALLGAAFLLTLRWMMASFDRTLQRVERTQAQLVDLVVSVHDLVLARLDTISPLDDRERASIELRRQVVEQMAKRIRAEPGVE